MEDEKKKPDEEGAAAEPETNTEQERPAEDKAETEQTGTEEKAEEKTDGKPEEKPKALRLLEVRCGHLANIMV